MQPKGSPVDQVACSAKAFVIFTVIRYPPPLASILWVLDEDMDCFYVYYLWSFLFSYPDGHDIFTILCYLRIS